MEAKSFEKEEKVFDHYVATHPHGDVLQTTSWGKLKSTTGWKYYPLAVVENGQITASSLILSRKTPIVGHSILYSPRGPLFSNKKALDELLKSVKKLAKSEHAIFWKVDPAITYKNENRFHISNSFKAVSTGINFESVQPKFIMELNIQQPLDTILANMKSKTRYNIRYAQRKGVKIILSRSIKDLDVFYPILKETAERDKFAIRSFEYFQDLWKYLIDQKLAQLFLAYHENDILGGTIAFKLGNRTWYVYGASRNFKRNLQPNYAIQWEMIRWAKGLGCHTYDFRGISGDLDPNNPLYGLYKFKEGFGAKIVEYIGEFDLVYSKLLYPVWQTLLPAYQRVKKNK